jgi:hypothetical protein
VRERREEVRLDERVRERVHEVARPIGDVGVPVFRVGDEQDAQLREAVAQLGERPFARRGDERARPDDRGVRDERPELVVEERRHAQIDEVHLVTRRECRAEVELPHRLDEGKAREVGPPRERQVHEEDSQRGSPPENRTCPEYPPSRFPAIDPAG